MNDVPDRPADHPPIPPNTPEFFTHSSGRLCYSPWQHHREDELSWSQDESFPLWVDDPYLDACYRHLVACVARCGWLDEARRLCPPGQHIYDKGYANAEAWRKWGSQ